MCSSHYDVERGSLIPCLIATISENRRTAKKIFTKYFVRCGK